MTYDQLLANYYTFWGNSPPQVLSVRLQNPPFPNPLANLTGTPTLGTNEPTDYNTCCTPSVIQRLLWPL